MVEYTKYFCDNSYSPASMITWSSNSGERRKFVFLILSIKGFILGTIPFRFAARITPIPVQYILSIILKNGTNISNRDEYINRNIFYS